MWQDYVITAGAIIFAIALLPGIFHNEKPRMVLAIQVLARKKNGSHT